MSILAYFSSVKKEGADMLLLHTTREEHCVCVCGQVCTHACMCVHVHNMHAAVYQVGNYLFC
jgi:hypothetical protein